MKLKPILTICCVEACLLLTGSASAQQKADNYVAHTGEPRRNLWSGRPGAADTTAALPRNPSGGRPDAADTTVHPARHLKGITVEAKRMQLLIHTSHPVQILAGEDLQKRNSLSVADAVRFFSGVQLKDYGGIGGLKTINVRSMGTNHTAVFYDGLQLGNAQNGQVDLGRFSLDNIDSISLYSGQQNNIFQPARGFSAASALYIASRQPGDSAYGNARIRTGSFGLINPSVRWQQKISKRIYGNVSAEYLHAHGRYRFRYTNGAYDTTATRNNADVKAWRVEGGLKGYLKDSSNWTFKVYGYQSERGLPGAIVANHFEYSQRLWDRDLFAQAGYNKQFTRRYSMQARIKYTHLFTRYHDPEYQNEKGFLDNRYTQQEWYLSIANRYQIKDWWEAVLSTDFIANKLDANIYRFSYPVRYTTLVVLASRIYFERFEMQGSLLGTMVDEQVRFYTGAGSKRELTPSFSASWQPFAEHHFRIRAFYKNIFRMPTFNDLYYTFIGNTSLRPEYTNQYNAGFSYAKSFRGRLQYIALQADAYYNNVKDKIVAVPAANLFRWTMMNLDKVVIKGVDVNLRAGVQPVDGVDVTLGVNYTFQEAQDQTPGGYNYGHQIPYTPRHSGSFTANASWRHWDLNYSFIYTGERYSQKTNILINYIEPWYTSDMSLSKCFSRYGITAEVNNLLNQYYDVILNFPMPGRHFRITGNISF